MTPPVYYVVRQRRGWGVEQGGIVRSGHATREQAIDCARSQAARIGDAECRLRIQEDGGAWREERSFLASGRSAGQDA